MITEERKNLWSSDFDSFWRCITINGKVNFRGQAVMGRGCALEAALKYPWLKDQLGKRLQSSELGVWLVPEALLIMFPSKFHWRDRSSLSLIRESCIQLRKLVMGSGMQIVLPRPGCHNGGRNWVEEVKPIVVEELGSLANKIVIVSL